MNQNRPNIYALLPLGLFFILYLATWIVTGNLSNLPISVAFLLTIVSALILFKGKSINERVDIFCQGAANSTIILMILIFILAGTFAGTAKAMGAVDATVNMILSILPQNLIIASLFVAACFISMSMGTSCGTIAALAPIALGVAQQTDFNLPLIVATVIGGSMFGDSLSFISDTTIVATKTQGCELKDKFKVNIRILFPITIIITLVYIYIGKDISGTVSTTDIDWIKVLPYSVVLVAAIAGLNVIAVLILGIVLSGAIGLLTDSLTFISWAQFAQKSIVVDMGELIIVSLMAGGLFEVIRQNGGIDWLINQLSKNVRTVRQAEFRIAALTCFTDLCTANNTVALIIVGPIAKKIGSHFKIDSRRMASLIDTFSCSVQGILPYGAQLLIASSLSGIDPLSILPYSFYPVLMGVASIVAIAFQLPRKYT